MGLLDDLLGSAGRSVSGRVEDADVENLIRQGNLPGAALVHRHRGEFLKAAQLYRRYADAAGAMKYTYLQLSALCFDRAGERSLSDELYFDSLTGTDLLHRDAITAMTVEQATTLARRLAADVRSRGGLYGLNSPVGVPKNGVRSLVHQLIDAGRSDLAEAFVREFLPLEDLDDLQV